MSERKPNWGPATPPKPPPKQEGACEEETVEREHIDRKQPQQRNGREQPSPSPPTIEGVEDTQQANGQANSQANGLLTSPASREEPEESQRADPQDRVDEEDEEFGPPPVPGGGSAEPRGTQSSPTGDLTVGAPPPPDCLPEAAAPRPPEPVARNRPRGGILSRAVKRFSGVLSKSRMPAPERPETMGPQLKPLPSLPDPSAGASELEENLVSRPSQEAVEERITLALRETTIEGFSRIAVGSPKGGVGKSSLAYAVAGTIAYYTNIRVCLVDADPEFGATRMMVPRPIPASIVEIARDAHGLHRLSDIRRYIAQNERMRVDVALNPPRMADKGAMGDLPAAYERIDEVLGRVYDVVIYDLGIGFSHPQIQKILSLADQLLLVGDSEVVSNALFDDALDYLRKSGLDLKNKSTLCINHRSAPIDESSATTGAKEAHRDKVAHITEVPYDAAYSQLLNRRAMHVEDLAPRTRLGILTTAGACLTILRERDAARRRETASEATDHRLEGGF